MSAREQLGRAASLLRAHADLLAWRPDVAVRDAAEGEAAPSARAWSTFLLGLDDAALGALEARGADGDWSGAPPTLRDFVQAVRAATDLPRLLGDRDLPPPRRGEPAHKQRQVDAFARLVASVAGDALRVVDIGSGHGHLTRALAAALDRPALGLERDPDLAARARALAARDRVPADFVVADVLRGGLSVRPGDCVVGLHACGELGDVVVSAVAAAAGPAAVVFVGCCLQKQRAPFRRSLSADGAALSLPKALLGLSNLTPGEVGVEASREENVAGRRNRVALRLLLAAAGVDVRPRAELEGANRRAAHAPLAQLVAWAFRARDLPVPAAAAIDAAAATAASLHQRWRRLALPRTLLGRVIEVFVGLDRAARLAERGFEVDVGVAWGADQSPRNVALVASRR